MVYFLKKTTPSKKGLYLQIYQSYYVPGKGKRNKSCQVVGYVDELKERGIEDPVAYAQRIVDGLNENADKRRELQIGDTSSSKNIGYFLIKAMIDALEVDNVMDIMTRNRRFKVKEKRVVAFNPSLPKNRGSRLTRK